MGLFNWFRGRPQASAGVPANRDPTDDRWYGVTGEVSAFTPSGVPMTYDLALQIPAVLACLKVLSETVAALPIGVFRRQGSNGKVLAKEHPQYRTLHARPNANQTAYELRQQMQWDAAFWRNAYARLDDSERGPATVLTRIDPRRVTPRALAGGRLSYEIAEAGGRTTTLTADRVLHACTAPYVYDGSRGQSMIETSSHTLGQAYAVQEFGSAFFANYTASGERIIPPAGHKWADEESRLNWLRAYVAAATGRNRHKPRLLPNAFTTETDMVNNEQAQFIETKKEAAYDIARLWRMPPHKIQLLDRATNNNIEHQGLEFVTDTLMSWLVMWEQCYARDLIADDDEFFVEHNVAGLLRGDIKSRYAAYAVGRQWGWISVNEIRAMENQNPVDGGDQYLRPLNMVDATKADPLGDLEKEERGEPPPGKPEPDENAKRLNGDGRH